MNTSSNADLLPILSIEEIYKLKQDFQARHARIPAAVRMSSLTQQILTKDFALLPSSEPYHSICGIPLVTDESIPPNQFRIDWPMRRQITFTATGKLAEMRLEDVKGERVWFNGAEYEVAGVDDTWDVQGGFKRTITAHELTSANYSGEYS